MTELLQIINKRNQDAIFSLIYSYHEYGASWSEIELDIEQYEQEGDLLEYEIEAGHITGAEPAQFTGDLKDAWEAFVKQRVEMDASWRVEDEEEEE